MTSAGIIPIRLRLSRASGFDLQATSLAANGLSAVNVARPSKWGNPWRVGDDRIPDAAEAVRMFRAATMGFWANGAFCPPIAAPGSRIGSIIRDVRGLRNSNLACWCQLGQPCHADVLLEMANAP